MQDRLITGEFSADYSAAYRQRPLQWAWGAVGALLGAVWLLLAGLGKMWAVAAGTVLAVGLGASYPLALTYVARHVGAAMLLATAIVLLGRARRPHSKTGDVDPDTVQQPVVATESGRLGQLGGGAGGS